VYCRFSIVSFRAENDVFLHYLRGILARLYRYVIICSFLGRQLTTIYGFLYPSTAIARDIHNSEEYEWMTGEHCNIDFQRHKKKRAVRMTARFHFFGLFI
jgi:hypothetical protein